MKRVIGCSTAVAAETVTATASAAAALRVGVGAAAGRGEHGARTTNESERNTQDGLLEWS